MKTVTLLILGYICGAPLCAQSDGCLHQTVPVSVARNDDVPVGPLSIANFEGTYRKKPVRITSAAIPKETPRVVLLLDVSASMRNPRSESNWNLIVDRAEDVLSGVPPNSEVGLGFFSNELEPVALPTTDRKPLLARLESLRSEKRAFGKTALWAAIFDSLKMLDHPHLGDVIYVITDGEDNKSKVTMAHVTQTLDESGVRLFAFLFQKIGFDALRSPTTTSGPVDVLRVTEDTGGRAIGFSTSYSDAYSAGIPVQDPVLDKSGKATWLGSHLRSQLRQMSELYRLDMELPEPVDKAREWKLDVVGFDKSQQTNIVLKYPHILMPCH